MSIISLRAERYAMLEAVRQSFFVYAGSTPGSGEQAEFLSRRLQIGTIDTESKEGSTKLQRLQKFSEIVVPSVLLKGGGQYVSANGELAIREALAPVFKVGSPQRAGMRAAFISLAILTVFAFSWRQLSYLGGALWACAGVLVSSSLIPRCNSCLVQGNVLSVAVPALGTLAFSAVLITSWPRVSYSRMSQIVTLILAFSVIFGQAILLRYQPKLCPGCLLVTFCAIGCLSVAVRSFEAVPRMIIPSRFAVATMLILGVVSAISNVRAGALPTAPSRRATSSFVGSSAVSHGLAREHFGSLVLVTAPGCEACDQAESDLRAAHLPYVQIGFSDHKGSGGFFADHPTPTPLLLYIDENGTITWDQIGWSTREGFNSPLIHALRAMTTHKTP